jgi:hypothetical protein
VLLAVAAFGVAFLLAQTRHSTAPAASSPERRP